MASLPAPPFLVLLGVLDAIGLLAGVRLLLAPTTRCPLRLDLRRWLLIGVVWCLVATVVAGVVTGSGFGVLAAWTHGIFIVLAPLAAGRGLQRLLRRRLDGLVPLGCGAALLAVFGFATFVEPFRLQVNRHTLDSRRLAEPLRVVVLADLQTDAIGRYEQRVFETIDAEKPDLVLLPGDFVQLPDRARFEAEAARLRALVASVRHRPRLGWWAVPGDIDFHGNPFVGTEVHWIEDAIVRPAERLQLVGLSLPASRLPPSARVRTAIETFDGLTIVMGHAPDFALPAVRGTWRPEVLLVAGHTHGGQVVVPGFGPPLTLTAVPRRYARGGLFELGDARLLISRGIGLERGIAPRVRFLCPPELVVIDLVPVER